MSTGNGHRIDVIDRRTFLAGAGSVGLLSLAACSTPPRNTDDGSSNRGVKLPTYIKSTVVTPDLAGDAARGIPDGYLAYPADPPKATSGAPAKGGEITTFTQVPGALPPPMDRNPFWQELNKRVGATMRMTLTPQAEYGAKLATLMAGGDLPEMVQFSSLRDLPNILKARFQDLTPYLSGDAVKDYPNLAALPTTSWRNTVYSGGIYGIPFPLGLASNILFKRQDILDEIGATDEITSGEDLLNLFREVTKSKSNRWAIGAPLPFLNIYLAEMFDAPNEMRVEDDTFTSVYETEEYKAALDQCAKMWKEGLFHPDALGKPSKTWFGAGTVVFSVEGYSAWPGLLRDFGTNNPKFRLGAVAPQKWEGGGAAAKFQGTGMFTFTALRKASEDRIKELLNVLNWFASPFGSEEYRFRKYGIADRDYTLNGSDPIPTSTGAQETLVPTSYIANPAPFLYQPGNPDGTREEFEFQQKIMEKSKPKPTIGLYSATSQTNSATISKNLTNVIQDIISGRKPISTWDEAIKAWRAGGGDEIKRELGKSYAEAND